jgi:ketosteroid isomerase-like protein
LQITPIKLINDADQHMAVMHARGSAETPVGPYRNEYSFYFTFNEDGTKIVRVEEFHDSAFFSSFFPKLAAHVAQQAEQ